MNKELSTKEVVEILSKVKNISETTRNPEWGDNPKRAKKTAGKVCNRAAAPKDLGASNRDQTMTVKLRAITKMGYLKETVLYRYPYFALTDAGKVYLAEHNKT
jgi:hypothetical protein